MQNRGCDPQVENCCSSCCRTSILVTLLPCCRQQSLLGPYSPTYHRAQASSPFFCLPRTPVFMEDPLSESRALFSFEKLSTFWLPTHIPSDPASHPESFICVVPGRWAVTMWRKACSALRSNRSLWS